LKEIARIEKARARARANVEVLREMTRLEEAKLSPEQMNALTRLREAVPIF
jgi:hypothetical protein